MKLKVFVPEGGMIPRFYEVAYRTWFESHAGGCGAVCYPIPLNWLVRWARAFKLWMRPAMGGAVDEVGMNEWRLKQEYQRGFSAGWEDRDKLISKDVEAFFKQHKRG